MKTQYHFNVPVVMEIDSDAMTITITGKGVDTTVIPTLDVAVAEGWVALVGRPNGIVTEDYERYADGGQTDEPQRWKGFGGAKWQYTQNGKTFTTNNLWYQGKIPELFRPLFPINTCNLHQI